MTVSLQMSPFNPDSRLQPENRAPVPVLRVPDHHRASSHCPLDWLPTKNEGCLQSQATGCAAERNIGLRRNPINKYMKKLRVITPRVPKRAWTGISDESRGENDTFSR